MRYCRLHVTQLVGYDCICLVYIHRVQDESLTFGFVPDESFCKWKELGITFFDTYVGAAVDAARQRNLISLHGLRRVCVAAIEDFGNISVIFPSQNS